METKNKTTINELTEMNEMLTNLKLDLYRNNKLPQVNTLYTRDDIAMNREDTENALIDLMMDVKTPASQVRGKLVGLLGCIENKCGFRKDDRAYTTFKQIVEGNNCGAFQDRESLNACLSSYMLDNFVGINRYN